MDRTDPAVAAPASSTDTCGVTRAPFSSKVLLRAAALPLAAFLTSGCAGPSPRETQWVAGATASVDALADAALARIESLDAVASTPSGTIEAPQRLANGSVGVEVWTERGGAVNLRLAHVDAYSEVGQPRALGELRIACDPPLPTARFAQRHRRLDGAIEIVFCDGAPKKTAGVDATDSAKVSIVLHPESPHLSVSIRSRVARMCEIRLERWRDAARTIDVGDLPPWAAVAAGGSDAPWFESADVVVSAVDEPEALVWYHRNERSVMQPVLDARGLRAVATAFEDPLLLRTFGARVEADGFARTDERTIETLGATADVRATITVSCVQADDVAGWLRRLRISAGQALHADEAAKHATRWWRERWSRGWLLCTAGSPAGDAQADSRSDALLSQRLAMLSRGCGAWPPCAVGAPGIVRWDAWCAAARAALAFGDRDRIERTVDTLPRIVPALRASTRTLHGLPGVLLPRETTVFGLDASRDSDLVAAATTTVVVAELLVESGVHASDPTRWNRCVAPFLLSAAEALEALGIEALAADSRSRIVSLAHAWPAPTDPALQVEPRMRWQALATRCIELDAGGPPPAAHRVDGALGSLLPLLLERMPDSGEIRLLPAWPRAWNASFRLHAAPSARGSVALSGIVRDGRIEALETAPPAAATALEFGSGWVPPAPAIEGAARLPHSE